MTAVDHERIWLQNAEDARHQDTGRLWCQDKVWPDDGEDGEPTEYIRADLYEAALSERDAHSKEIERLRDCLRERPNTLLIAYEDGDHERLSRVAAKAIDRAEASEARITALEKALEPFAAIGRMLEGASDDHAIRETVYTAAFDAAQCLTVGDFRAARASFSPKLGEEKP